jgi:hypothetical protein
LELDPDTFRQGFEEGADLFSRSRALIFPILAAGSIHRSIPVSLTNLTHHTGVRLSKFSINSFHQRRDVLIAQIFDTPFPLG